MATGTDRAAGAATGAHADLASALRTRIATSLLPGETSLEGARLDEAVAFLLEAAARREEEQPALLIRTASEERRFTRVAVINRDMPFLVDSIASTLAARGLAIDLLVHPVLPVRREGAELLAVPEGSDAGEKRESWVYLETERVDARERRALEDELRTVLLDVRAAVADWPLMKTRMEDDADRLADAEGAALLRWLAGGMLTQLGHVVRRRDGTSDEPRGICRRSTPDLLADAAFEKAFAWFDGAGKSAPGRAPLIVKANRASRVHRRVPLDLFIVPVHEEGRVAALSVHAGLWTSAALAAPPDAVPVLRRQLLSATQKLGFSPGSHDYKGLVHALTVLPHDLVVGFDEDDLIKVATAMIALADRPRPRAALVAAPLRRHLFGFVWLPRDLLSTTVRLQIQDLLETRTGSTTLDWSLLVEGGNLALLRFVLDARGQEAVPDDHAIDRALQELLRGWGDAVEEALRAAGEEGRAGALAARFAAAFPPAYRAHYGAAEAASDIARLRRLGSGARDVRILCTPRCAAGELQLKVYRQAGTLRLSDAVPVLEHFGFQVLGEFTTELAGADGLAIHDFTLAIPPGMAGEALLARAAELEQAIADVLAGRSENDVFNRLTVVSALAAREADWLRAIYRYLRQTGIAFTINTVVEALAGAPQVARALVALFRARHDPAAAEGREDAERAAREAIRSGLAGVAAINDDRILRLYRDTLDAVLRTNAFAPSGQQALAFKFDSARVPGLPRPLPWREIFVYSRRVEGIHLRAGPVARGGLRWSDRRDDFRTEILGLMKAQRVKNAVIVPTGAKGGFYPKALPSPAIDRDAWFAEGRESYKLFIRSLLSITDNIVEGRVVHPAGVVVHDGEDPYFVVAADKGTATFSDTANAIAAETGFWLGDAFASGGSNGYDHKAMGITARGAWISVQRHFRELGIDVQADPVRVAGCGDMSGDVFGNGMLLSRAIRLVACFDHRHIFLDPDPDPEASWAERKRLFALPRSSWADYDPALISTGGGVFPRSAKEIALTPQMRALLGIEAERIDPDALIAAILRSPVDLFWFGGIGTYVKAPQESHAQVGDPANDAVRVDATEMRCRVIGEGANLGVTQAGRIAFSLAGGRINTDFIDNSAGVDCSDNEVNIKIALAAAQADGLIDEDGRRALLKEMTPEVAELVLEDNRLQALALSIAEQGGPGAAGALARVIELLEEAGGLDRVTEGLPEGDAVARRAADGKGLTRPELAVLLSSAKLALQDALEDSAIAADPAAEALLLGDFPAQLRRAFPHALLHHRLRREIVATVVANKVVNRMGMVHPFELAEEEGVGLAAIGEAFVTAAAVLRLDELWQAIETAEMGETARLTLFAETARALRAHMGDLLRAGHRDLGPAALTALLTPRVDSLAARIDALLGAEARNQAQALIARLEAAGAPPALAAAVARVGDLDGAIGLALLAHDTGHAPDALAAAFVRLGETTGIDWAQGQAAAMSPADPWERLLVATLARDFQQMRLDFLRRAATGQVAPLARIGQWEAARQPAIAQARRAVTRARAAVPLPAAALAQLAAQARTLLAAGWTPPEA